MSGTSQLTSRTDADNRFVVHLSSAPLASLCGKRVHDNEPKALVAGDGRSVCQECARLFAGTVYREKRVALALLAGWTTDNNGASFRHQDDPFCQRNPSGSVGIGLVPDHLGSLDAFATLVSGLDARTQHDYRCVLIHTCDGDVHKAVDAGVSARARALLIATGRWRPEWI